LETHYNDQYERNGKHKRSYDSDGREEGNQSYRRNVVALCTLDSRGLTLDSCELHLTPSHPHEEDIGTHIASAHENSEYGTPGEVQAANGASQHYDEHRERDTGGENSTRKRDVFQAHGVTSGRIRRLDAFHN
jgi:hypothetical protein